MIPLRADPNAIDAGYAPLHVAVLRGDRTLVSALLDAGAEPNTRYTSGTPVRRASRDWYLRPQLISATPYWLAAYYQEPEIMKLLVKGLTARNIAKALSISDKTVSTYRSRIMKKMNMNNTSELIHYAIENKLSD